MEKNVIKYKKIKIDQSNIYKYRSDTSVMLCGESDFEKNQIIIYRYSIGENLNLKQDDEIYEYVKYIHEHESKTIAHELKHFENRKLGDPLYIAKNYYELAGMYVWDEVSAHACEYLKSLTPCYDEVCHVILKGIDNFIDCQQHYIPRHMQQVENKFLLNNAGKTFAVAKRHLERNLSAGISYSNKYNKIISAYLTFNGQSLYDSKHLVPATQLKKIKNLCKSYEKETTKTLQSLLKRVSVIDKTK